MTQRSVTAPDAHLLSMIAAAEAKFDDHRVAVLRAGEEGFLVPSIEEQRRDARRLRGEARASRAKFYDSIQNGWVFS